MRDAERSNHAFDGAHGKHRLQANLGDLFQTTRLAEDGTGSFPA